MKKFKINFESNLLLDFLIAVFLSHIYYKITFIETIEKEFSLISQIRASNVTSTSFFVESPTNTIIALLFGINDIDIFKIVVYIITVFSLTLIVFNIQFLERYSTLFLFGGWLTTVSWFIGYVDAVSVLLIVLISKFTLENENSYYKLSLLFLALSVNHNAIAFAIFLIILFLTKNKYKFSIYSFIGILIGNLIVRFYLDYIGFSGRGRLRFVFNQNVLQDSISFLSENLLIVLWSGFLGVSVMFFWISNFIKWMEVRSIFISMLICLFFTSLGLDTSRVFSILLVPVLIYLLNLINKEKLIDVKTNIAYSLSVLSHFIIGIFYVYGNVYTSSPMNNKETFYNFIVRIVNSLMSNIWN